MKPINNIYFIMIIMLFYLLSSCGNNKIAQCKKISKISDNIAKISQDNLDNKNSKELTIISEEFTKNGEELENLANNFQDENLKDYGVNLGKLYQQYGENTLKFLDAFQKKDVEKAIVYKEEIYNLFQKQEKLVNNINSYCQ